MATTAQNKFDVDKMTTRDKLWDSLHHVYGQQIDESNRNYDRAISQSDRQMLSHGTQRSSFAAQIRNNLNNQKINAENNIWSNLIADYENRSIAADQQDIENAFREKQYADSRADTIWNQNFQQAEADRAADQFERKFAQGNNDTDRQLAASYVASIVANGGIPSDDLLARAGLSRADAELMAKKSSGGGYTPPTPKPTEEPAADDDGSSLFDWLRNFRDNPPTNTTKVTIDEDKVKSWFARTSGNGTNREKSYTDEFAFE